MILSPKVSSFARSSLLGHDGKSRRLLVKASMNPLTVISDIRAMVSANAKSGTSRKIDMEKPAFYLGQSYASSGRAINGQEKFISSRGWRSARAKGRGNQAIGIAQAGE